MGSSNLGPAHFFRPYCRWQRRWVKGRPDPILTNLLLEFLDAGNVTRELCVIVVGFDCLEPTVGTLIFIEHRDDLVKSPVDVEREVGFGFGLPKKLL